MEVREHVASTRADRAEGGRRRLEVLAVVGSPRKGHSYRLVQRLEQLLCEEGDVKVEVVLLGELNLRPCRGCYVCQSKGEGLCPLRDDLSAIVGKMKAADGVILVSPTYTNNVSGLMKNLMDRMAWTAHRPQFLAKPAMLVTTASSGTSEALRALSWFRYTGFEIVANVGWSVWPSPRRDWLRTPADDRALLRAVRRLRHAMEQPRRSLPLFQVIAFYVMRATGVTDPQFFGADEAYHRDIDALGFDVPRWKKWLGEACYRLLMAWFVRRLGVKARRSGFT